MKCECIQLHRFFTAYSAEIPPISHSLHTCYVFMSVNFLWDGERGNRATSAFFSLRPPRSCLGSGSFIVNQISTSLPFHIYLDDHLFSLPIIISLFYNASLSLLSISVQPTYLAEAKCITIQVEVSLDFLICSVLTSLTPVVTSKIIFSFLCRTFIFPFLRFEWSLENDFVWREKNC